METDLMAALICQRCGAKIETKGDHLPKMQNPFRTIDLCHSCGVMGPIRKHVYNTGQKAVQDAARVLAKRAVRGNVVGTLKARVANNIALGMSPERAETEAREFVVAWLPKKKKYRK